MSRINSPTNAIQACLTLKSLLGLPLRQGVRLSAIGPRSCYRLRHRSEQGWRRGEASWRACRTCPDSAGPRRTSAPCRAARARRDCGANGAAKARRTMDVTIPYSEPRDVPHLLVSSRTLLRNTLPGSGQHGHHGGRRSVPSDRGAAKARSTLQAHAWRLQAAQSRCRSDRWRGPLMAQDPPRHRRDGGRSGNRPGDLFRGDWMTCVKLLGQRLISLRSASASDRWRRDASPSTARLPRSRSAHSRPRSDQWRLPLIHEPRHGPWHPDDRGRRVGVSWEKGTAVANGSIQQRPARGVSSLAGTGVPILGPLPAHPGSSTPSSRDGAEACPNAMCCFAASGRRPGKSRRPVCPRGKPPAECSDCSRRPEGSPHRPSCTGSMQLPEGRLQWRPGAVRAVWPMGGARQEGRYCAAKSERYSAPISVIR